MTTHGGNAADLPGDARSLFTTLVEDGPDAIARLNRRGRILYANRRLGHLFDREPAVLIGSTMAALDLPVLVIVRYRRAVRHTFHHGTEATFAFEVELDGKPRHFQVRALPETADDGSVVSTLAITSDVTERTTVERQRDALFVQEQAARAKAESAARARDQFLSVISHELRSPLNGIQSWSHVLENQLGGPDGASPLAMRALEGIRAGIDQQVRLIEHLLDATVSMTGSLQLVNETLVLREAIDSALAEVRAAAIAKDLAMYVEMHLVDERMDGDPHRVHQIFAHLLSNAVKFTPRGGSVWLTARRVETGARIDVRDSGRGLAAGFERWLFEPFSQADSSNTRRSGGVGLGLALARRLAELHGGRLDADSAGPHLGSTFTVTLPLHERRSAPRLTVAGGATTRAVNALAGLDALVVDDQLEAREALSALLVQFGATVSVAASSRDGMASVDRSGALPDFVICDIAMPEEDGYGFVRRLRAWEAAHPEQLVARGGRTLNRTPVVALSAFALADKGDASAAGFDAYLTKPVDPRDLLAALSRLVLAARRRAIPAP